jgi:hypothetical protein
MTALISGSVQRFKRLSFRRTRIVPMKPETLAETRVVWREASNCQTSSVAIPLARAIDRISPLTRWSASGSYLLKSGSM